jgi:hypothetical protein
MNAQFNYDGRIHTFRVSIGPRPNGKIGPPTEVVVDRQDPSGRALRSANKNLECADMGEGLL